MTTGVGCGGTCCAEQRVLDKGFVRTVEATPDADATVVRAARVSHGNGKKSPEEDAKLIRYLLANDHGTPFEHNLMTFHVKAPIFVARQWFRHRIGQSYNEISARYAEVKDEWYTPTVWRAQAKDNKQGSIDAALEHQLLSINYDMACEAAYNAYRKLLERGVAKEMARLVLPQAMYTEWYWTVNARSLMAFIKLRSDKHAQWEIRQYSDALLQLFLYTMPITATAFIELKNVSR